jgi:hypothetical protein
MHWRREGMQKWTPCLLDAFPQPLSSMHFLNHRGCSPVQAHHRLGTLPPWTSASSRRHRGAPRCPPTPCQAVVEVLRATCQHRVEVTTNVRCIEVAHSPWPPTSLSSAPCRGRFRGAPLSSIRVASWSPTRLGPRLHPHLQPPACP